jgi:hypothetical protein
VVVLGPLLGHITVSQEHQRWCFPNHGRCSA